MQWYLWDVFTIIHLEDHKENKIPRLSSDADFASYLDTKTMIEDFVPVLKS